MRRSIRVALMLSLVPFAACGQSPTGRDTLPPDTATRTPLRVLGAQRGRYVGAAIGKAMDIPGAEGDSVRAVLAREFSMVWSGRFMKWGWIHPARDSFNFAAADSMVDWARQHDIVVRGHTLSWYQDVPAWAQYWPVDSTRAFLREHIQKVVDHFRGKVVAWEVASEVVAPNGSIRPGTWTDALGLDNYLELAFRTAREADPSVPLYINDYSIEWIGPKSDALYEIIKRLKAKGVPIDGVGFQGHFMLSSPGVSFAPVPAVSQMVENFNRFAALGLQIQVTEIDLGIPTPVTDEKLKEQAAQIRRVVEACLQVSACNTVMMSGVYDGNDWIETQFPGFTAPVLYDKEVKRKPAYFAFNDALAGK